MPRSTARAMLVLAVVVGLLAGCSADEPEPAPTSTAAPTSAAPEPEPEPVEEVPEEPEAPTPSARTPGPDDAVVAGDYFMELHQYVRATGDLTTWDERSYVDCGFCANVSEQVLEANELGTVRVGGEITAEPAEYVDFEPTLRLFAVEIPYSVEPLEIRLPDGEVTTSYEESHGFLVLELGYHPGDGWLLFGGDNRDGSSR